MIHDMRIIEKDPMIEYIGFNIEKAEIVSEKIYYKKEETDHSEIDKKIIQNMIKKVKNLHFFSEEKNEVKKGIVKYDFLISDTLTWLKTMSFLENNVEFYDKKIIKSISRIRWLETMFTTIGIRFCYDEIVDMELYYRRISKKRARLCKSLWKLIPKYALREFKEIMDLMFSNGAWVRLVAIDFQKETKQLKIYFETNNPQLIYKIADKFKDKENYAPLQRIIEYSEKANILFVGMAIVIDMKKENIRYNLYYKQK